MVQDKLTLSLNRGCLFLYPHPPPGVYAAYWRCGSVILRALRFHKEIFFGRSVIHTWKALRKGFSGFYPATLFLEEKLFNFCWRKSNQNIRNLPSIMVNIAPGGAVTTMESIQIVRKITPGWFNAGKFLLFAWAKIIPPKAAWTVALGNQATAVKILSFLE